MNQTFNLKRFTLLFIKHTADNFKTYLMTFFVLLGVLFLTMGFAAYVGDGRLPEGIQIPFFIFVLIIAGSIFTSIIFADLGNKKKAIAFLTLPASHFEKYLIGWVYSFLIFQLLFIPAFYLVAIVIQHLGALNNPEKDIVLLNLFSQENQVYIVFIIYAILHSLTFLGSITFQKLQFIKTGFLFFIGIFLLTFFNTKFMQLIIGKQVTSAMPFGGLNVMDIKDTAISLRTEDTLYIFVSLVLFVGVLWVCTYYKLKEKEV